MSIRATAVLSVFVLVAAACGGSGGTDSPPTTATTPATGPAPPRLVPVEHRDPAGDCRSAFAEGPAACGPGADIAAIQIDPAGPIVVIVELATPPHYDIDFQWLAEFVVSDLACGITNTSSTDSGFVGSEEIGPYGYRVLTNENAPPGTCDGSLDGTTATIVFNIQAPQGPWSVAGGTQHVEIQNLEDDGSADDVVVEMTGSE